MSTTITQADTASVFSNSQHVIRDFLRQFRVSPGSSGRFVFHVADFDSRLNTDLPDNERSTPSKVIRPERAGYPY